MATAASRPARTLAPAGVIPGARVRDAIVVTLRKADRVG